MPRLSRFHAHFGQFGRDAGARSLQLGQFARQFPCARARCGLILADLPESPLRVDDAFTRDSQVPLPAHQILLDAVQHHGSVRARLLGLQASHPRGLAFGLRGPQLDKRRLLRLVLAREELPNSRQPILEFQEIHRNHRDFDRQAPLPQILVALRLPFLPCQGADLGRYLRNHVLQPLQVQFGAGQPPSRDPAPVLVFANARGFLEQPPALLRPFREDCVDHSALDDRVGVGAESGVPAKLLDVAQTTCGAVDRILASPIAIDGAPDLDLAEGNREQAVLVGDPEDDRSAVDGPTIDRALEDHLFHA